MTTIIYPGTFDPITNGHLALIQRVIKHFNLLIAVNTQIEKKCLFNLEERVKLIKTSVSIWPSIEVLPFSGFLIDFARHHNVQIILRGLRSNADFEFEIQMANINKQLDPEIETMFLMANENNSFISSSAIKELAYLGGSIEQFVPAHVANALKIKFNKYENNTSYP